MKHPGAWRAEARSLRDKMSSKQIAAKLGLPCRDVSRFLDQDRDSDIDLRGESAFIKPHVYRVPKQIDMGPIVAAARAAVEARRA